MIDYNTATYKELYHIAESLEQGAELISPYRGIENFKFVYYGKVVAKQRARGVNFYTPTATREFENAVKEAGYRYMVSQRYLQPFAFPMRAIIDIHAEIPENWPVWKRSLAVSQLIFPSLQDTDNKVKAIQDGLNQIVYRDDKQIVSLRVQHVYRKAEMFTLQIEPLGLTKLEVDRLAKIMKSRGN